LVKGVGNIGLFDFSELFEKNLGSSDYMALAKKFSVIFIKDWKKIKVSNRN